ncbi:MAG: TonB-dependent receptor [Pseudomonadota bacterium]
MVSGGNPNLVPEKANTLVAGFVYQPSFVDGLSLSADWYKLDISDSISSLGAQRIVNDCFSGASPQLCSQVNRNAEGLLGRVFNTFLNVAQYRLRGIDYEASYQTETNFFDNMEESINIRALAGYQAVNMDVPYGATTGTDVSGTVDNPDLTGNVSITYNLGPYSAQVQQRYIAGGIINPNFIEGVDVDDNTVESYQTTNLRLGYNAETQTGATWSLGFNITNLLDEAPPRIAGFELQGGNNQVVHNNYDWMGRRYQVSFNMNF